MLEYIRIIRDSAYAERIRDTVASSEEELEIQIKRLRLELTVLKVKEAENSRIMQEFVAFLATMQLSASTEEKQVISTLSSWFNQRLNKNKD